MMVGSFVQMYIIGKALIFTRMKVRSLNFVHKCITAMVRLWNCGVKKWILHKTQILYKYKKTNTNCEINKKYIIGISVKYYIHLNITLQKKRKYKFNKYRKLIVLCSIIYYIRFDNRKIIYIGKKRTI